MSTEQQSEDDGPMWLSVEELDALPDGVDVCNAQLRPWAKEDGLWDEMSSAELVERSGRQMLHPVILVDARLTRKLLRSLLAPRPRPLRVEVCHTKFEAFWRVVHTSNGQIMGQGEGYDNPSDRDHAVEVLFPGVEVVEVDI